MSFFTKVSELQKDLKSRICLGLDPREADVQKGWKEWAKRLIGETAGHVCSVKPNMAFYQAGGIEGLKGLEKTIEIAHDAGLPVILDQKIGDIGSTASAYAKGVFDWLYADAVTLSPYMGSDAIKPFLEYSGKGVFVLCRTSNKSGEEFQHLHIDKTPLYVEVAKQAEKWGDRVGLVIGATQPDAVAEIRKISNAWLLLPGLGAQGGDALKTAVAAKENFIFPISRGISHVENPKNAAKAFADEIEGIVRS